MYSYIIIWICYWIIADGIREAYFSVSEEKVIEYNIVLFLFGYLFVFCGLHYALALSYPIIDDVLRAVVIVPFAFGLSLICNRFAIKINKNVVVDYLQAFNRYRKTEKTKNLIFKSNISLLVIARLEMPNEKLTILDYSESFYHWYSTEINTEAPINLTGLNWYDLFPNIKDKWKEDHAACIINQIPISRERDYWEERDIYLKWTIEPVQDNVLLISFDDITTLIKEIEFNKRLVDLYSKSGIAPLFDPDSSISKLVNKKKNNG